MTSPSGKLTGKEQSKSDSDESDDGAIILERLDVMRAAIEENTRRMRGYEDSLDRLVRTVDKMASLKMRDRTPTDINKSEPTPRKEGFAEPPTEDQLGNDGDLDAAVLHGAFVQIRDSVAKTVLPARLSMGDTGPNVRGESRKMLNFIRKCAGYTSTMLRVMKMTGEKAEPEEADWDILFTCISALHKQFQS
jgi:hypothetical protein